MDMEEDKILIGDVIYTKHSPIDCAEKGFEANYAGFKPETKTLKKGAVQKKGYGKLPCDIIFERDVAVKMRDGVTIYCDIFRPVTDNKVPAIVAWSPYGKNGSGNQTIDVFPGKLGIHADELSGLAMFEAPDPGYWVSQGYAVCNVDIRGAFMSEGNTPYWGKQDGEDGYDFIEWVAEQPWCNGKVALSGNSWLAISQWHIAVEKPPHLAAIAPWESSLRMYQDDIVRGGVDSSAFCRYIIKGLFGNGYVENPPDMVVDHRLYDDYWNSKEPDISMIDIPIYQVASWSNQTHTNGTFAAWRELRSENKWLRVHNEMEWVDYYKKQNVEDLRKFFDRYLKNVDNGWEKTPQIRMSVLDLGSNNDIVGRVEKSFPPEHARLTKLYLSDGGNLSLDPQRSEGEIDYQADKQGDAVVFEYQMDHDIEILGYPKLQLWIETDAYDNADIFAYVQKVLPNGKVAIHQPIRPDRFPWKTLYKHLDMDANKVPSRILRTFPTAS
ncbi:MAG: CocE/NonD family hydrolase [Gordonibacter urolithinfaciens]